VPVEDVRMFKGKVRLAGRNVLPAPGDAFSNDIEPEVTSRRTEIPGKARCNPPHPATYTEDVLIRSQTCLRPENANELRPDAPPAAVAHEHFLARRSVSYDKVKHIQRKVRNLSRHS
jgi:hypothetical protein